MLSSLAGYGSDSDDEVIVPSSKQNVATRNTTPSTTATNANVQKVTKVNADEELMIESVGPVGVSNMNYKQVSSAPSVASSSTVINSNVITRSEKKEKPLEQKKKKQKTNSYKKNLLKQISEHSLFNDDSKKKGKDQTIEQERFLDDEDDNDDYNYNFIETKPSEPEEEDEEEKPKLYIPRNNDVEIQNDDNEDDFEFNPYYNEEDDEVYKNLENITPEDNEEPITANRGIPQDVLEEMKRQGIDVDSGNFEILDVSQNGSSKLINVEAERRKALIEKHKRDVFLTKDESDALKQFNFTTEGAGDKNRVKVARTKNQISYLAQQSRGRELEMAERLEKSRQSSSTAKRKYGW
ncbi:predicted protein [Naegleria gruberi]|uniref:Predicted protein n=1 Tax=Naegleria gruberi TaxID=5762 RepID=D2V6M7_NAEGR|nr:uncharacterized protein NAEGRDRAFT_78804 [Naegleria gruberi]EFC47467.1 predicted protein [Naegleria gruberi]|eukprot:XP_002680211.1 predicted protein [Naegleria gruberi strain NEG-M]